MSLEPMKIATKCKRRWREWRWTKKNWWISVNYVQSYKRSCLPTLSRQCAFEFGPRDFDAGEILPPPNFPPIGLWAPGGLMLGFAPNL